MKNVRLALFINFIPPYHIPTFDEMSRKVGSLRIFVSAQIEPNRNWAPEWAELDVVLQHNFTIKSRWRHPQGFSDSIFIQLPYDTIFQLLREKADVVISTEMGMRSLMALVYRLFKPSSRLILWLPLSEHTEKGRGWMRNLIRKLFIQRGDAFFVNGASGARYIRQLGVTDEQTFLVPYPTDEDTFFVSKVERSAEIAHRLLYVGQLTERKGLLPFINTLAKWAKDNPQRELVFHIVGEGELGQEIRHISLPENLIIKLEGGVPYNELKDIYVKSGIFVFPTFADEWGIVANEALACGLPVLGSIYSQAVEELVDDGNSGWKFAPDDEHSVYEAINWAMKTSPKELDAMRKVGQVRALSCTPDRIVESMLAAVAYVRDEC